jgi:hypothetical protein
MVQVRFSRKTDLPEMNFGRKDISLFQEFYVRIGIIGG